MLYCKTYSVYTQNSEKQKAEEQQLAGYVNTWEKWQRLTNCVTLSVHNGSSMPVILHWTVQLRSSELRSSVMTYVFTGCMCLIWLMQWEKRSTHIWVMWQRQHLLCHRATHLTNVGFRWTMLWSWQIGDHCQKEVLSVTVRVVKEAVRVFGSCTEVHITKDLIHSVLGKLMKQIS